MRGTAGTARAAGDEPPLALLRHGAHQRGPGLPDGGWHSRRVTRFAIDASTVLRLVTDGLVVHPAHRLVAPSGLRSDALALLYDLVRRGELTEGAALQHHERLTEMKVRLLGDRSSRRAAWRLAQEQGWLSTRDAEHIALARLQADALITVDPHLAARAAGLVPLAPVSALSAP